ncbi:MAG: hypothetical protein HYW07_09495 [Candidatus Latescibacteria bacterium]|nr:hypothetical protein [Candidatus Latescibacterota bacterium]
MDRVGADHVGLTLVNTDPVESRTVLIQAGTFGEHEFAEALLTDSGKGEQRLAIRGRHLRVHLGPAAQARLDLGLKRFVHRPSYAFPALS